MFFGVKCDCNAVRVLFTFRADALDPSLRLVSREKHSTGHKVIN